MVVAEPPITEQWWFWTIIGGVAVVVVAAVAIGIVLGTQNTSLGNDRTGTVIFTF
jgi:hypothetical protein